MRGDNDGTRNLNSGSIAETNGSSSPHASKSPNSGTINGTSKQTSNGLSTTHSNGTHHSPTSTIQPTFYGHDREEVIRILIQGLTDLGYDNAAGALSHESGYDLETPYASAFRVSVLRGDWTRAESLLSESYATEESGGVEISADTQTGFVNRPNSRGRLTPRTLVLSNDASRDEMLFLIRQQKYLELLEARDLASALTVLQQDLQSLHQDERRLHALSRCVTRQSRNQC